MKNIRVLTVSEVERNFGRFSWKNIGGGRIQIDPSWVKNNIVDCVLAKARNGQDVTTKCHWRAKEPFERAFKMIEDRGLSHLIKTFDGLWVPRHQLWRNNKPLSRHSWGIAIDLNAEKNPYGEEPSPENRALNEVFNLFGFAWGGDWSPRERDPMHWEMSRPDAWTRIYNPVFREVGLVIAVWRDGCWSYHRIKSARFEENTREHLVEPQEVKRLLNVKMMELNEDNISINELLHRCRYEIVEIGNHLNDRHNPRLYLFVKRKN